MKKGKEFIKKYFLWFAGICFVILYLYADMIFDNYKVSFASHMYAVTPWNSTNTEFYGPIFSDLEDSEYPALYSIFKNGKDYSIWNNEVALGTTDSINYVMYPLNYLYILPMDAAVWIKTVLEFAIAFLGLYLLLREYKCLKISSAIAGVIYAFSASIVMWLGWSHSDVAAWAPFAFFLGERIIKQIKLKYALWLAVVIYIMLVAGMPTFAAYFMYLLGCYVLIMACKNYWKEKKKIVVVFGLFGIAVILGAVLSLPYTMSLVGSVGANGYTEARSTMAEACLDIDYIRTMIYPYFREGMDIHVNESTLYIGMLAIVMIPFAFVRRKEKKYSWFYAITSVIIFLLIFTHLFDAVYTRLPMINTSLKYRIITLLMFTMAVMTGLSLDDILKYPEVYRKKIVLLGIWIVWGLAIINIASKELISKVTEITDYQQYYNKAVILFIAFAAFILLYIFMRKKVFAVAIAGFVIWDMCGFANEYLPWIEKSADIIPEATESIEYMQENTSDNERVTAVGEWTYMANANCYYDLNDVRAHSFVMTNQDIQNYYKRIDSACYRTATRVAFTEIENYNLLKYLGVKYIAGENVTTADTYNSIEERYGTTEVLEAGQVLSQEFMTKEDSIYAIQLLAATCGEEFVEDRMIHAEIVDTKTGEIVTETAFNIKGMKDNAFLRIVFGKTELVKYRTYKLVLTMPGDIIESFVIYRTAEDEDSNELTVSEEKIPGHLIMMMEKLDESLEEVFYGEDGLNIAKLDEYAPKAMLAETIFVKKDEEEILEGMGSEYIPGAVFLMEENADEEVKNAPLAENESVEVQEYADDHITIKYTAEQKRYLVINEYYDSHWKAYINGKEIAMVKADYLLRAVEVPKGTDVILELKYDYSPIYRLIAIAIGGGIVIILLGCFSQKIQQRINKTVEG